MSGTIWKKGNPHTVGGMEIGASLWKVVWMFLKKLKIEPTYPAIPLLGIYLKIKTLTQRDIFTPVFKVLFITAKIWKC